MQLYLALGQRADNGDRYWFTSPAPRTEIPTDEVVQIVGPDTLRNYHDEYNLALRLATDAGILLERGGWFSQRVV